MKLTSLFEPLYRWLTAYMGRHGLILYGFFDCDCACAAAPDYSPVANASKESAEVMAALGREQIAEAKRQYDQNQAVSKPVVDAQLELMRQGIQQGNDYFDYGKSFRPLEQQMLNEVSQGTEGINAAERAAIRSTTESQANQLLQDANNFGTQQSAEIARLRQQQEAAAGRQTADAQAFTASQTAMANQMRDRGLANDAELRARTGAFERDVAGDIDLATGGRTDILNRFRGDINEDVGRAVADTRVGQTQALNSAMRQAARYGLAVPANAQMMTNQNAASLAAAANNTRTNSIENMRNVVRDGIGLKTNTFQLGQAATESAMNRGDAALAGRMAAGRDTFVTGQAAMADADNRRFTAGSQAIGQAGDAFRTSSAARTSAMDRQLSGITTGRNMRIQDQSLDFARKLDVTGMARGMPGASQGAYSVANQSGNSAVQNQMAPGNSYLSAVQGGIGAIGQGQQMQIGGLSNVLSAQTSYTNGVNNAMMGGSGAGGLGSVLGGVASLYSSGVFGSDRRLKEDIGLVGQDERTGLNLYEFAYIDDPEKRRFVGVMADEVIERFPDAVGTGPDGFMTVNYARLGIEMKEVA